jgi:HEPN domain-containing protein
MTPRRQASVRPAQPGESRQYLSKAEEYLHAATTSKEAGNYTATVGNSVHTAIAAANAISVVTSGNVWRGEHSQAADHLDTCGEAGRRAARHLRSVLPLKSRAEYDPDPVSAGQASKAIQAAERILRIATEVVKAAPS